MLLADVIFPAPSAAYVANLFFPISAVLALAAEFAVFAWFQGRGHRTMAPAWRRRGREPVFLGRRDLALVLPAHRTGT